MPELIVFHVETVSTNLRSAPYDNDALFFGSDDDRLRSINKAAHVPDVHVVLSGLLLFSLLT